MENNRKLIIVAKFKNKISYISKNIRNNVNDTFSLFLDKYKTQYDKILAYEKSTDPIKENVLVMRYKKKKDGSEWIINTLLKKYELENFLNK